MSLGETERIRNRSPVLIHGSSAGGGVAPAGRSSSLGSKQRNVSSNTLIGRETGELSTSPIVSTRSYGAGASSSAAAGGVGVGVAGSNSGAGGGGSDSRGTPSPPLIQQPVRRSSFGLTFLSSLTNTIRPHPAAQGSASVSADEVAPPARIDSPHQFMSNSPTIANLSSYTDADSTVVQPPALVPALAPDRAPLLASANPLASSSGGVVPESLSATGSSVNASTRNQTATASAGDVAGVAEPVMAPLAESGAGPASASDKDGFFSIRLTPLIDHSSSTSGLYFAPIIRKIKPNTSISIGRYTEKNKSAAHAPQGSSAPVVFKSKVVSRTHALFQCNDDGQWLLQDCKSSSGTFLNHIRLSPASQELSLMPLVDGDIIQLGMDYRGGTEEVYRCVKMRCEFNKSWQRKVNQFNLEIHKKLKNLAIGDSKDTENTNVSSILPNTGSDELSECAICLLKLEPCQALFISPCSHSWHYKCIRPIIIKSYPQFYCPNCRSMCDLETDIEDDDE